MNTLTIPTESSSHKYFFKPTTNTSRDCYNYAKENPGLERKVLTARIADMGHPKGSVASLLARMLVQGTAEEVGGLYYIRSAEYQPIKSGRQLTVLREAYRIKRGLSAPKPAKKSTGKKIGRPRKVDVAVEVKAEPVYVAPAPAPVAAPAPVLPAGFQLTADYIIKHVSLAEAKALYDELGHYFK